MAGKKRGRPPKAAPKVAEIVEITCVVDDVSISPGPGGRLLKGEKAKVSREIATFLAGRNQVTIKEKHYEDD